MSNEYICMLPRMPLFLCTVHYTAIEHAWITSSKLSKVVLEILRLTQESHCMLASIVVDFHRSTWQPQGTRVVAIIYIKQSGGSILYGIVSLSVQFFGCPLVLQPLRIFMNFHAAPKKTISPEGTYSSGSADGCLATEIIITMLKLIRYRSCNGKTFNQRR